MRRKRPKLIRTASQAAGLAPGTPVYIGKTKTDKVTITVIDYDESQFQEKRLEAEEECLPFKDRPTVTWINVDGVHDLDIIKGFGRDFDLHPLIIEDIVNTGHPPKMEDFDSYIFIVLKMLYYHPNEVELQAEQVSIILGRGFVISFQEREGDVFDPIRERIRNQKGRIRKMGSDYLAYSLVDAVIDGYFAVLEKLGEKIEAVEEDLLSAPTMHTPMAIHDLKQEMIFLRRSVWPLREVVTGLTRAESPLIDKATGLYLRDAYDHTIQVIDTIETFRDTTSGMLDVYLSSISNRMNEVMKVLTIIATIFIPLTFVAGVYGMNFQYMPELHWRFGYFAALFVMVLIAVGMGIYFRKKKWL